MAMSCYPGRTLQEDEISKQHWSLKEVLQKGTVHFESHNRRWKFLNFKCCKSIDVIITCMCFSKEEWEVRVGIEDKIGNEIASAEAKKRKEGNSFKVLDLIKESQIPRETTEMLFFVEIARKEDEKTRIIKEDLRKLQSQCEELLSSGKNSDVTITVKGKRFNCHKSVLAKNSPVFADMFANMKKDYVLESDCVEPDVFHQFLLYLYTSSGKYLSWENCTCLFVLGEVFDVYPLMELCKAKWKEHLLKVTFSYQQWIQDRGVPAEKVYIFMDALRRAIKSESSKSILIKNPYILVDIMVDFVENHNCNKVKPIQRMSKPAVSFQ